jgi:hypothetical protein
MSDVTKVAETSRRGLEPVNPKLVGQYNQIIALLAQRLGPDHAFLFAEPMPLGGGAGGAADTAWYCKGAGTSRPLSALSEAEAAPVRAKLAGLVQDIESLAEQMQCEGGTSRELGRLLRDALVLPDAQRVWVVDDRPVLVDWGNRTQAGTSVSALGHAGLLTGMGGGAGLGRAGTSPRPDFGADPAAAQVGDGDGAGRGGPPRDVSPPVPRQRRSWTWLAQAALWIVFVALSVGIGVRLLDACALGPELWPSFVRDLLPGSCPALTGSPDIQAASAVARRLDAQIRQQEMAVAVKAARCDCQPATTPVNTPKDDVVPPPLPPIRDTKIDPILPPPIIDPISPVIEPDKRDPGPNIVTPRAIRDIDDRLATLERGVIEVTLAWDGPADLDLHVNCPDNKVLNFRSPTACGGRLVSKDLGVGGGQSSSRSVEHVVWQAQPDPTGNYAVRASLYKRYTETRPSIPYTVVMRVNGKIVQEQSGQLANDGQSEKVFAFTSPVAR